MATKLLNNKYLYNTKDLLGKGSFGSVYKGKIQQTGEVVAVKAVDRYLIEKHGEDLLRALGAEVNILQKLMTIESPYIVKIYDCFDTGSYVYIILEYCDQGTVEEIIDKRKKLPEREALEIMYNVICAIDILSSFGITHRDLKPENIFIKSGNYKLGDFGFASEQKLMKTLLGTYPYMAPEIFKGEEYDKKVDVWAIGVMLHQFIFGELYYIGKNHMAVQTNVLSKEYIIPTTADIAPETKDLLRRSMIKDPKSRISIMEMKTHPCFQKYPFYQAPKPPVGAPAPVSIPKPVEFNPLDMSKFQHFLMNGSQTSTQMPRPSMPAPIPPTAPAPIPSSYSDQPHRSIYPQFNAPPPQTSIYAPPPPVFQPAPSPPVQTFTQNYQAPASRPGPSQSAPNTSIYPGFDPVPKPGQNYGGPNLDRVIESTTLSGPAGQSPSLSAVSYLADDMILMLRNIAMLFIEFFEKIQFKDQSDDQIKLVAGFLAYRKGYQLLTKVINSLKAREDPAKIIGMNCSNWETFKNTPALSQYIALINEAYEMVRTEFLFFFNQHQAMLSRKFTGEFQKLLSDDYTQDFDDILSRVLSMCRSKYMEKASKSEGGSISLYLKIAIDSLALTNYKAIIMMNFDFSSYYSRIERMQPDELRKVVQLTDVTSFIRYFQ